MGKIKLIFKKVWFISNLFFIFVKKKIMKYINILTKQEVIVSDLFAAGVCIKTRGKSFVVFKKEGDSYSMVMENREFHTLYEKCC
jgi:hypothetical protein